MPRACSSAANAAAKPSDCCSVIDFWGWKDECLIALFFVDDIAGAPSACSSAANAAAKPIDCSSVMPSACSSAANAAVETSACESERVVEEKEEDSSAASWRRAEEASAMKRGGEGRGVEGRESKVVLYSCRRRSVCERAGEEPTTSLATTARRLRSAETLLQRARGDWGRAARGLNDSAERKGGSGGGFVAKEEPRCPDRWCGGVRALGFLG